MAMTRLLIAFLAAALVAPLASAQDDGAPAPRYRLTDQVLEITPGTTMFALVFEHYPERKNRWLNVAADLAEANPHAFRNGDPGDVIVGQQLTLIDYGSGTATPLPAAVATSPSRPEPAAEQNDGQTAPPAAAADQGEPAAGDAQQTAEAPAARPRVGRITSLSGDVRALGQDGRARRLGPDGQVLPGDTLVAGPDARVVVAMIDGARFELTRGAHVVVEDYVYGRPSERAQSTVTLLQGALRIVTGSIARDDPDAVFVNTPMATIGAHEADFALMICASGACRRDNSDRPLLAGLYAGVVDGEIAMANNTGKRNLASGEFVRVRNQQSQADPALDAAELLYDPALLSGLDIQRDEPLGFWAWFRERFL